jgi:heterodisulfide reductase subunit A
MIQNKIAVIGGGIAGMETAIQLDQLGYSVDLIEKENALGGHVKNWFRLFPDRRPASEILEILFSKLKLSGVNIKTSAIIKSFENKNDKILLYDHENEVKSYDALVLCTGFDLFDARRKEEYGFGIYENVITSAGLEALFTSGEIRTKQGSIPKRVGIVHCVGSRDEQCGNHYCSKSCCVSAVKQAIEIREMLPSTEVFCFYMDLRMFGPHYEELYRESQEKWGVQYIRGRVSEAAENADGSIQVKAEDTLTGRPLKMNVDMLILMVGMEPGKDTQEIARELSLKTGDNRFFRSSDEHYQTNFSGQHGVFFAGAASAPMNITDSINHARSAVLEVDKFLKGKLTSN